MTPQRAAHLTAIAGQSSPAPVFGDLGSWMAWNLDTLAGELACDAGEWVMKKRQRRARRARQAPYQPILLPGFGFLTAYYSRQLRASLPGPWPVKVIVALVLLALVAVAQIIPGQFDDAALLALPKFFRWIQSRKAEAR